MSDQPLVSMCLIARDEAANVAPCLSTFWDHVDEIVLVITGGPKDKTAAAARAFAAKRRHPRKLTIRKFKWRDDFAAARNHAESLATGQWHTWADLDDTVVGAEHLRDLARTAPDDLTAYFATYDYAQNTAGQCICALKRERLVRAGAAHWKGRVHEAQIFHGGVQLMPDQVLWRHRKQPGAPGDRNLRILEQWNLEEPRNPRVLQYLGTERSAQGHHDTAVTAYREYLELEHEPAEHRAQAMRRLACSLLAQNMVQEAFAEGLCALGEYPAWPDCYLTLAQAAYTMGEPHKALQWADETIRRGQPDTPLIVNPLDYTVEARVVMAASYRTLGRLDEACRTAETALELWPDHPILAPTYRMWRSERKRQSTMSTWLSCAEILVAHDEQQKALVLLETTVPYYCVDAPEVVKLRSELRERLAFAHDPGLYAAHYETGGSKPEDGVADDQVVALCGRLPRAQFLVRQLREMQAA